ncbi:MAG: DUF4348 domain-containing protein [Bacteroidota bacterium]|nr:DUF4348 domain-containing protein [Bacteroidota bacterium]
MKQISVIILSLLLFNCTGKVNKSMYTQYNDATNILNEDFDKFYNYFVNDSLFQISRVIFPIKGVMICPPENINDTLLADTNVIFERKNWRHFKNIAIDVAQFDKEYRSRNDSVIDVIISAKYFDNYIERTFVRRKGKWYLLTFYSRWS